MTLPKPPKWQWNVMQFRNQQASPTLVSVGAVIWIRKCRIRRRNGTVQTAPLCTRRERWFLRRRLWPKRHDGRRCRRLESPDSVVDNIRQQWVKERERERKNIHLRVVDVLVIPCATFSILSSRDHSSIRSKKSAIECLITWLRVRLNVIVIDPLIRSNSGEGIRKGKGKEIRWGRPGSCLCGYGSCQLLARHSTKCETGSAAVEIVLAVPLAGKVTRELPWLPAPA